MKAGKVATAGEPGQYLNCSVRLLQINIICKSLVNDSIYPSVSASLHYRLR